MLAFRRSAFVKSAVVKSDPNKLVSYKIALVKSLRNSEKKKSALVKSAFAKLALLILQCRKSVPIAIDSLKVELSKTLSERSALDRFAPENKHRFMIEFSILDWSKMEPRKSHSERLQPENLQPDKSRLEKFAPVKSYPASLHPRSDSFFAFNRTLPVSLCKICTIACSTHRTRTASYSEALSPNNLIYNHCHKQIFRIPP